ncbi:MAG: hypothetical protein ACYC2G_03005 [Gemmatimonadaceae bacterium]
MTVGGARVAPAIPVEATGTVETVAQVAPIRPRAWMWRPGERLALVLIALWIPLQLLAVWPAPLTPALDGPWSSDAAIFVYEGALVRQGSLPYRDFWDHKGPLIYLVNAAGLWLSDGRLWGVWAAGLVATWAAAAAGYRAMRDSFGVPGTLVGLLFFVLALGGMAAGTNMTEHYALPLAWGSALVLVRWARTRRTTIGTGIALGALGMLSFLLRANLAGAAISAALVIAVVLIGGRRPRGLLRAAAGAAIGVAVVGVPVAAWLARGGALQAFWDQAIVHNLLYSRADLTQRVTSAIAGVWLATVTAPLILPVAGLALCIRRLRRSEASDGSYPAVLFAVTWTVVELLLASVSGRPYDHYFTMLLPPFAMLSAALVAEGSSLVPVRLRRRVRPPALVAALLALVMARPLVDRLVLRVRDGGIVPPAASSQAALTASYVRAHSAPDDRLLVWGLAGGVYFLADRPPASRYLFAFPLLTPTYGDSVTREFLADIHGTRPAIIVDAAGPSSTVPALGRWDPDWRFPRSRWYRPFRVMTPSLRAFYDLVERDYTAVAVVGPERWVVYRANRGPPRPRVPPAGSSGGRGRRGLASRPPPGGRRWYPLPARPPTTRGSPTRASPWPSPSPSAP